MKITLPADTHTHTHFCGGEIQSSEAVLTVGIQSSEAVLTVENRSSGACVTVGIQS